MTHERLSCQLEHIRLQYDVVVVGSGYGGGVAASRLSRAGYCVCVLEQGKEFTPGEFPDTEYEALGELQIDFPGKQIGTKTALYDFRVNDDIVVFKGCGLGGTSLVNANVSLEPDARVFEDIAWPAELRSDGEGLRRALQHARDMLKPTRYPATAVPLLPKLDAHERSSAAVAKKFQGTKFARTPINVTFRDGVNHVGVHQRACTLCGDCVSGCNYGAKNTVAMNYLPDARNHGAEFYCEVGVQFVKRDGETGNWRVFYTPHGHGRGQFGSPDSFVTAPIVVLAAGSLGSTEILMRSREKGLALSETLGSKFTGNGDVLALAYNGRQKINGIGFGDADPESMDPVGPCITSVIDARCSKRLEDGFVLEEGSIPGALRSVLPTALAAAGATIGEGGTGGLREFLDRPARELGSMFTGGRTGAVENTQVFLVMSHDDADGKMRLKNNRLRIEWPGVTRKPVFERVGAAMASASDALGATYIKNPLTSNSFGNRLVTVHPLGGCCMAETHETGVVNHRGQVFSADGCVHDGLYVMDGAIVPRSLGVNPLLTITLLAERCCAELAASNGRQIDYAFGDSTTHRGAIPKLGIKFTERMAGHFGLGDVTFDGGAATGLENGELGKLAFVLTIVCRDIDMMIRDPAHKARMFGTVEARALSRHPLTVSEGHFQLFVKDRNDAGTRYMRYEMDLTSEEGDQYHFSGQKVIHDDPGFDIWEDTTTLFVTVADRKDDSVVGRGVLRIAPTDFVKQMSTVRAVRAGNARDAALATMRFTHFFMKSLYDAYL